MSGPLWTLFHLLFNKTHFTDEATEAPRENLSVFVHSYTTEMIHTG